MSHTIVLHLQATETIQLEDLDHGTVMSLGMRGRQRFCLRSKTVLDNSIQQLSDITDTSLCDWSAVAGGSDSERLTADVVGRLFSI